MDEEDVRFDWHRANRTGVPEVVFAQGKTASQLKRIAVSAIERNERVLMTRIDDEKAAELVAVYDQHVSWHQPSSTLAITTADTPPASDNGYPVAIVAAGTSDHALVAEVEQCLIFLGVRARCYVDVGVAGLWRLTDLADELRTYRVLIAIAGMEGALFSVLAGLVHAPVVAVPSSVGYGVSSGGHAALNSALSSCAPGIAVVNIDNGFGAAALAVKMLGPGALGDDHS